MGRGIGMPLTIETVRAELAPDEPDYSKAAELGQDAIPYLKQILDGSDTMLASKATYLASLIRSEESLALLEAAAKNREPIIRIAAASGLHNLSEHDVTRVSNLLIEDKDVGVRKVTLKSISNFRSSTLIEKVQKLAERDPEPFLRDLAANTLAAMKR
jgi:HEAT repeat protein